MPTTLPAEVEVLERTTTRLTGTLVGEDKVTPLPGSTLTTFVLTVYVLDLVQTVIVDHRNVLNAGGGTVDELGAMVVLLSPDDMRILTAGLPNERHLVLLEWTWGIAPVKTGRAEFVLVVRNLGKVS